MEQTRTQMQTQNRKHMARTLLRILFTCCLIGTVIFIFSNSRDNGIDSGNLSKQWLEYINGGLEQMQVGFRFSENQVRKLAHFAEYTLLGFWLMLTLRVYTRRILSFISWPLFLGLLTAVLDEFSQLFVPGRSGQVRDVVIDFGGVTAGLLAGLFALLLASALWEALWGRR